MPSAQGPGKAKAFTERELEILTLLEHGLSNREIADRLVLSLATVKWYNQQIFGKLGVGTRTQALARARDLSLLKLDPDAPPLSPVEHQLPAPLTSFIGRARELAEVRLLLERHRLLTLTGPGGMGKTRLALEVTAGEQRFSDGVYFVPLASISSAVEVPKAIADVLNIAEVAAQPLAETIATSLRSRNLLLILDNFEHVMPAAPLITDLLTATRALKVLVTSREVLHLSGEQEYPVPPLDLPLIDDQLALPPLLQNEAVTLFIQRAQAVKPAFQPTEENVQAVAEICVRLDGLPLAIELAAARIRLLPPHSILARLERPLQALGSGLRDAPARQQTLRQTIDWSYHLLSRSEQMLFARLAVFRRGCTLEAAEAVCGENLPVDVIDGLFSLADKSLIRQEQGPDGNVRLSMLETIREYAHERLEASGEEAAFRNRHADYFLTFAERAEPELMRDQQVIWLDRLDEEHDNLRAALTWLSAHGDDEKALRLIAALTWFWFLRSHSVEGLRWFDQTYTETSAASPGIRATVLSLVARLAFDVGDYTRGLAITLQAQPLARAAGDARSLAIAIGTGGFMHGSNRDYDAAEAALKEAADLFRADGFTFGAAWALNALAEVRRLQDDYDRTTELYTESLRLFRELGNVWGMAMVLSNIGFVAQSQNDVDTAQRALLDALQLNLELRNKKGIATCLTGLAGNAVARAEWTRAARLLGAVSAVKERIGSTPLHPPDEQDYHRYQDTVSHALGEGIFQAAWDSGRAMSLEQAVAYAHDDAHLKSI